MCTLQSAFDWVLRWNENCVTFFTTHWRTFSDLRLKLPKGFQKDYCFKGSACRHWAMLSSLWCLQKLEIPNSPLGAYTESICRYRPFAVLHGSLITTRAYIVYRLAAYWIFIPYSNSGAISDQQTQMVKLCESSIWRTESEVCRYLYHSTDVG